MSTAVNPETEAALAVIRAEETNPAYGARRYIPDHSRSLVRELERLVAQKRATEGGTS